MWYWHVPMTSFRSTWASTSEIVPSARPGAVRLRLRPSIGERKPERRWNMGGLTTGTATTVPASSAGSRPLNRLHDRVDARVLGSVDPCCQAKTRARTVAVHDDQRDSDRFGGSLADGQESAGARSRFGHNVPNVDRFRFHSRSSRPNSAIGTWHMAMVRILCGCCSHCQVVRCWAAEWPLPGRSQPRSGGAARYAAIVRSQTKECV